MSWGLNSRPRACSANTLRTELIFPALTFLKNKCWSAELFKYVSHTPDTDRCSRCWGASPLQMKRLGLGNQGLFSSLCIVEAAEMGCKQSEMTRTHHVMWIPGLEGQARHLAVALAICISSNPTFLNFRGRSPLPSSTWPRALIASGHSWFPPG